VRKFRAIKGQLRDASEIGPGPLPACAAAVAARCHEATSRARSRFARATTGSEFEGAKTLDMRDFKLEPPKILMLEVQAQINLRAKIRAVRAS
jgi:hypothetical protein